MLRDPWRARQSACRDPSPALLAPEPEPTGLPLDRPYCYGRHDLRGRLLLLIAHEIDHDCTVHEGGIDRVSSQKPGVRRARRGARARQVVRVQLAVDLFVLPATGLVVLARVVERVLDVRVLAIAAKLPRLVFQTHNPQPSARTERMELAPGGQRRHQPTVCLHRAIYYTGSWSSLNRQSQYVCWPLARSYTNGSNRGSLRFFKEPITSPDRPKNPVVTISA